MMKTADKPQELELAQPNKAVAAPTSTADSVLAAILEAAKDPAVDVEKFERLMAMQERAAKAAAEEAFNNAMAAAQAEMKAIAADAANPQTKSRYASYHALDKVMRPIYSRHKFALSFNTADGAPEGYVRVVCDVTRGGFTKHFQADMPADGKGAKGGDVMTKTHASGAAMTYGQRYLLKMIFNIVIGDDNDGNDVNNYVTQAQEDILRDAIEATGADMTKFLAHFQIGALAELPEVKYGAASRMLEQKAKSK